MKYKAIHTVKNKTVNELWVYRLVVTSLHIEFQFLNLLHSVKVQY